MLAKEKGFGKLFVSVDFSVVVGMLWGNVLYNARYEAIAQRCKSLIRSLDWEVLVCHCYREINQVADTLANIGVNLTCKFIFFTHPLG